MKFFIKDNLVGFDEVFQAITSFYSHNRRDPEYIIVHPETENNIILAVKGEVNYEVIRMHPIKDKEELKPVKTAMGISVIRSYDVEPGFMLIV